MKDVENIMQKNLGLFFLEKYDSFTLLRWCDWKRRKIRITSQHQQNYAQWSLIIKYQSNNIEYILSLNSFQKANRLKTQKKWQYAKRRIIFCLLIWVSFPLSLINNLLF